MFVVDIFDVVDVVNVAFEVEYLPLFSSKLTDFFF